MKISRLVQSVLIALYVYTFPAQAQMHDNAWMRTTLGFSVAKKIKVDAELQHRRQNGFGNLNMLDKNLMFSARTWIHYQYKPWFRLSASPYACFRHFKPIANQNDEKVVAARETRFALAADLRPQIAEKFTVIYRVSMEYRLLDNYPSAVVRLRSRTGLSYRINQRSTALAYNEIFVNANVASREHAFDHNRIAISLEYEIKHVKLEAGYVYITRLPLQANNLLYENNLFLNFTYAINKG